MTPGFRQRVERALKRGIVQSSPLTGGNIAETVRVVADDRTAYAVKFMAPKRDQPDGLPVVTLKDEAFMLERLRSTGLVPVPEVVYVDREILILEFIPCDRGAASGSGAQAALADIVARLHGETVARFGFDRPTPIGPLQRPNGWSADWPTFLRDSRLLYFGRLAEASGRLPTGCFGRLERLCADIDRWIPRTGTASLIHGDMWIGNILFRGGEVAALIDPATYYADPEIELAFLTLFGGVGDRFFDRYAEHRKIDPLFFEERRPVYHLEPLLAHAWFFGGGYGTRVDEILTRYVG